MQVSGSLVAFESTNNHADDDGHDGEDLGIVHSLLCLLARLPSPVHAVVRKHICQLLM